MLQLKNIGKLKELNVSNVYIIELYMHCILKFDEKKSYKTASMRQKSKNDIHIHVIVN